LSFDSTARAAASAPAFYGDPPDEHHPWAVHDGNRPQPKVITPGTFSAETQVSQPPSDAVVLFNGTDLSNWESANDGSPAKWLVKDGVMEVVPKTGEIRTKEQFGDCQLHVEWAEPKDIQGTSQRHIPDGHLRNPGPGLVSQHHVCRRPRRGHLWRQPAYGQRPPPARRVPDL
jgi:hypothetical protein